MGFTKKTFTDICQEVFDEIDDIDETCETCPYLDCTYGTSEHFGQRQVDKECECKCTDPEECPRAMDKAEKLYDDMLEEESE